MPSWSVLSMAIVWDRCHPFQRSNLISRPRQDTSPPSRSRRSSKPPSTLERHLSSEWRHGAKLFETLWALKGFLTDKEFFHDPIFTCRYPPALPWRNLNENGSISPEMRKAIIRPRSDSVYGVIQLDPVTGFRLPSMPEEEADMDYSSLCTICCDHAATVTLQPCGHNGLCVECAYSLDIW